MAPTFFQLTCKLLQTLLLQDLFTGLGIHTKCPFIGHATRLGSAIGFTTAAVLFSPTDRVTVTVRLGPSSPPSNLAKNKIQAATFI